MGKLKIIQLAFVFLAYFLSSTSAAFELSKDLTVQVRNQIDLEMKASLFYQTYAHYFENSAQALPGFTKFFSEQSLEEKKHADKLMTYLNKRNVEVRTLNKVKIFCSELKNDTLCKVITGTSDAKINKPALIAVEDALELEIKVYNSLENIVLTGSDPQLNHFIEHEYLDEQVESIKQLRDFKTQLTNIDSNYVGLLLFDRWLMDRKSEL